MTDQIQTILDPGGRHTPDQVRHAVAAVAVHARDEAEMRLFLDQLGLLPVPRTVPVPRDPLGHARPSTRQARLQGHRR